MGQLIVSHLVPMPGIPRWQHGNTLVWTAVTGGNTPVGTAAESQRSSSSGTAARTATGSLVLPGFLVCIHIEAPEAPKSIQQPCNQILLWKNSQKGTLLGCISSAWCFDSTREQAYKRFPTNQLCPRHVRHSLPTASCWLIMIHVPSQKRFWCGHRGGP